MLSEVVKACDQSWHILALVRDATILSSLYELISALTSLKPGGEAEKVNSWFLKTFRSDQRDQVVCGDVVEQFAPEWWPKNEPCAFLSQTVIGLESSSYIKFISLLPDISYLNSIKHKADRPQFDPGNAYLIAVDVENLPRAHRRLINPMGDFFSIQSYDHVSGVMLFDYRNWIGCERKQWQVSFFSNNNSRVKLSLAENDFFNSYDRPVVFELLDETN